MLRIDIVTCQPALLGGPFAYSMVNRAVQKKLVEIHIHDLRVYGEGRYRQIDDYGYGGEAGMVLMPGPIVACIEKLQKDVSYDEVIYMAPDGLLFSQSMANELSLKKSLLFLCGHYKGVDERVRTHFVTREVSIGDYVLSGGELAAAVMVDSVVRLIPGVLSNGVSALTDSFQESLVGPPVYTRPASFRGWEVPAVLRCGDPRKIADWKEAQAIERTRIRRPKLLQDEKVF